MCAWQLVAPVVLVLPFLSPAVLVTCKLWNFRSLMEMGPSSCQKKILCHQIQLYLFLDLLPYNIIYFGLASG